MLAQRTSRSAALAGLDREMFEKAGTETAKNGVVSDRYILKSDYVFHGKEKISTNGLI